MSRKMVVDLATRYDGRGMTKATAGMKKLGAASKTSAFALSKAKMAYLLAAAAAYKLAKASLQAAVDEEKSMKQLSNALRTVDLSSANSQVEAFIANLQDVAAVADDELRPAMAKLVSQLKDVAASEQVLQLATEISAATGKDLSTVVTALTRAYAGQRKGLLSLGLGMDATYLQTASLEEIIGALNDKFSGSSQTMLNSYSGRIQKLSVAFDSMKESIGAGILDALESVFGGFDNGVSKIETLGQTIGDFFRGLGVLWNKVAGNPIVKFLMGDVKWNFPSNFILEGIVELGRKAREESAKLHADDARENRRMATQNQKNAIDAAKAAAAKADAAAKAAAAKKAAEERAKKAQAAKAAALDKANAELNMKYDVERASLLAAMARTQSQDAKERLSDLLAINTAQYAQELGLTSMNDTWKLINEQVKQYTAQILASTAATQAAADAAAKFSNSFNAPPVSAGQTTSAAAAFTNAAPGSAAQFRAAEVLASAAAPAPTEQAATASSNLDTALNAFLNATQGSAAQFRAADQLAGTTVNLTVQGSVIAEQDLTDAVTKAVYSASYQGALNKLKANPALADF